jgi:hypothetical protein
MIEKYRMNSFNYFITFVDTFHYKVNTLNDVTSYVIVHLNIYGLLLHNKHV